MYYIYIHACICTYIRWQLAYLLSFLYTEDIWSPLLFWNRHHDCLASQQNDSTFKIQIWWQIEGPGKGCCILMGCTLPNMIGGTLLHFTFITSFSPKSTLHITGQFHCRRKWLHYLWVVSGPNQRRFDDNGGGVGGVESGQRVSVPARLLWEEGVLA